MSQEDLIKKIEKLDVDEKLLLIENIWESIANKEDTLPFSDWQRVELERRYMDFQKGKYTLHHVESVHSEIRRKNL